ncbi:MAG: small ribosomal subunit biogenesis GTPase RsgA [Leptolyngbyaceae cyanobacterium T60_A2020_046]|nr:small ribosomal subunit biogenesis GTPase RsgA [Leptolyngbyaceae cyanobacterium T60_A2020_046]
MAEAAASPDAAIAPSPIWGVVLSVQANFYWVRLDGVDSSETVLPRPTLLCTRRARLKKVGVRVMVGDRVCVEEPDWEGGRGAIVQVAPRRTQLDRPPIANADHILLVFALAEPELDPHQLTRFLVKAESTGLQVSLCLNKRDLVSLDTQRQWRDRLHKWGYDPILLSIHADPTLAELDTRLRDRITVVSGPSGVGKSSLINQLIPAASLRTGKVSGKLGRGRHTTRHVELFELPGGGLLADTPGFNQPDIFCEPEALGQCFPEVRDRHAHSPCQFGDCLHRDEPGCAIRGDWERYNDYLSLLENCIVQQQSLNDSPDPDAAFKVKIIEAGQVQHEPRLKTKKYRRSSRRHNKQTLDDLRYDLGSDLGHLDALDEDWPEDL